MQAKGPFPDLVTKLTNSFGGVTNVTYTPSTQYSNRLLPFPVQTVSEISTNDGKGNVATTYYKYSGGFFHVGERDFRGFNEVSVWGPVSYGKQTRTTTYFHQGSDTAVIIEGLADNPFSTVGYTKGKPYRTKTWGVTGVETGNEKDEDVALDLISETTTIYKPDADGIAPFFTPPQQVDNKLYDAGAVRSQTRTVYYYDDYLDVHHTDYGNVTREEHYVDVGNDASTSPKLTITRSFHPNTEKWIVGLPASESVFEGMGTSESDKVSHTDYYYDNYSDTGCNSSPPKNISSPDKGNLTLIVRWLKDGTDPETWMAYDDYGNLKCSRDPKSVSTLNGKSTTFTYDSSYTFPTAVTNPKQKTITTKYYGVDGEPVDKGLYGQVKSVADPNRAETKYEYDKFGRKILEKLPDLFTTSWDYAGFPQYIRTNNSAQIWVDSYLDGFGRTWREERKGPDSKTIVTDTQFDARGAIRQKSLPYFKTLVPPENANKVTFSYDALGRTRRIDNPDTTFTLACYTSSTQVTIDANGHGKRQTKDSFGRLVKVEEYIGTYSDCTTAPSSSYATTYEYDLLGNLRFVTDAKNQGNLSYRTEISYDSLGRKTNMKDPDMGEWNYEEYDPNGNLTLQADAFTPPRRIRFVYDALNRLLTKDYGNDGVIDVTYNYDETTSTNGTGRLTSMIDGSGSTKYHYDKMGRVTSMVKTVDGRAYETSFVYELGRLKSITYPGPDSKTVTYHYDPAGNLDQVIGYATYAGFNALGQPGSVTYGNGVVTTYDYVATNNRLNSTITTSPTQGALINLNYDYYYNGNVWKITDNLNTVIPHNFVSASFTPHTVKPHAIDHIDSGPTFDYDNNGNMKSDGKRIIAYNFENMPTSITSANSVVNYTYDGNGKRVKKALPTSATVYIDNLYECSNGYCDKHIYDGNGRIAIETESQTFYHHSDHLGSTSIVTNASGNKLESIAYYPFGETRLDNSSVFLNYKYTGQELDKETQLYNYNARLYDPELGRFISADSIVPEPANPQSLNRYSYVINNPLLYTDPTGHDFWKDLGNFFKRLCGDNGCFAGASGNEEGFHSKPYVNVNSGYTPPQSGGSGVPGGAPGGTSGGVPGNATWNYGGGDTAYGTMPIYANSSVINYSPSSVFSTNLSFGFSGGSAGGGASSGGTSFGIANTKSSSNYESGEKIVSYLGLGTSVTGSVLSNIGMIQDPLNSAKIFIAGRAVDATSYIFGVAPSQKVNDYGGLATSAANAALSVYGAGGIKAIATFGIGPYSVGVAGLGLGFAAGTCFNHATFWTDLTMQQRITRGIDRWF